MIRLSPKSTLSDTLFPFTTLFPSDTDIHRSPCLERVAILLGAREAVRQIGAAEDRAIDPRVALAVDQVEIGAACGDRCLDDAIGDGGDFGVDIRHGPFLRSG